MEETELRQICEGAGASTALMLGYHGKHGDVKRIVIVERSSEGNLEPRLRDSTHLLKDTGIGYDKIYSLKKVPYGNEPDGMC
jgi:hypothetical protein